MSIGSSLLIKTLISGGHGTFKTFNPNKKCRKETITLLRILGLVWILIAFFKIFNIWHY